MALSRFAVFILAIFCVLCLAESKDQDTRQFFLQPQSKETTTVDFVRLVVMRLIFGLASAMGYGDSLSNFFNGAFVPPGADDYDDDYDLVPDLF